MITTVREKCEQCGRVAQQVRENATKHFRIIHLSCGHQIIKKTLPQYDWYSLESFKSKYTLHPFQQTCTEFGRDSGLRCLYTLQMGLGKTVIAACLMRAYEKQMTPILIVCKSSLTIQWLMEMFEWAGVMCQVIENGKEPLHFDHFDVVISSMDMLRRAKWAVDPDVVFKSVIIDEVQHIKNPSAQRTQLLRRICAKATYVLGLSGTPIKNHAAEYFTILNILRPELFPNETQFIAQWVDYGVDRETGKFRYKGIKYWDRFSELTKDFIIHMTRAEVAPEIPKINRTYQFCDLGEKLSEEYQTQLARFKEAYDNVESADKNERWQASAALRETMSEMRQVVGLAKVKPVTEYVKDFIDNYSGNGENARKLVVFVHHIAVGDLLEAAINEYLKEQWLEPVVRMRGGITATESYKLEVLFRERARRRVMVASTLACGEGKNFQFCSDAIIMERQWNPANEEQAECRFTRIGSTADFVSVKYFVARMTFDEPMSQLVEKKRQYVEHSLSGAKINWVESSFMQELTALIYKGEGK